MGTPFIGEIRMFAGNFAPRGWAFCWGQLLPIAQNDALFALIGTTYGGDGQQTFALPDLRGRVPVHMGSGFTIGQQGGAETVTLATQQLPTHTHVATSDKNAAALTSPAGNVWAASNNYAQFAPPPGATSMSQGTVGLAGGSQPHDNMPPYLAINFIIALSGVFPSRN